MAKPAVGLMCVLLVDAVVPPGRSYLELVCKRSHSLPFKSDQCLTRVRTTKALAVC